MSWISANHIHLVSVLSAYSRQARVFDDSAIQERHDIEGCSNDAVIFAQTICLGHGNIGVLKSMENAVFAVDLVGSLGEQLARRFLSQDIALFVRGGQQIGRIGLSIAELHAPE